MPDISLFIADNALREAVVEQILAAKWGTPHEVSTKQELQTLCADDNSRVIIVDEVDSRSMAPAALGGTGQKRPVILALGGSDDTEGVSETFAKPFRLGHLMARLRYYLETAPKLRDCVISFGRFRLEPQNRRIVCDGTTEPIRLTEKETALLVFLSQRKEPATRQDILAAVWGYGEGIDTHTLETHIYQLRRKLECGGENWLVNEAGAYCLARGQD